MKPVNKDKIRTRMCKHYLAGFCKLGDACNFAHGKKFLRRPTCKKASKSSEGPQEKSTVDAEEYEFV